MAEEDKAISWSLKDGLIIVPFLASGLALTWEVGFFLRIKGGAFGLFSIAEHVTYALQALPIALNLVTLMIMGSNLKDIHRLLVDAVFGSSPSRKFEFPLRLFWSAAFLITVIVVFFLGWFRIIDVSAGHMIFRAGGIAAAFIMVWLVNVSRSWVIMCLGILLAFILAFGIGVESAQNEIVSSRPLSVIKVGEKGSSESSKMSVRVMRTGERGVLYFDPADRSFGLLPWEVIKRMDWGISPILKN
jgi:hypothetical protein